MEPYNLRADFFDTYQSLSDTLKALWLIVPPAFVFGLAALVLRFRLARARVTEDVAGGARGELVCAIYRDDDGRHRVVSRIAEMPGEVVGLLEAGWERKG